MSFWSIFGGGGKQPKSETEALVHIKNELTRASNGLSQYAQIAFSDVDAAVNESASNEMLAELVAFEERSQGIADSRFFYLLSIGYRNYTAWFVRGDARKYYLEKCVSLLRTAISMDSGNRDALEELASTLIDQKLVRNLDEGVRILTPLKEAGVMSSPLNSRFAAAKRQLGEIEPASNFSLCSFSDPSPGVFREERKRFRALFRLYKKQGDVDKLKEALDQYYKLAALVCVCYGDHDCNSGTIGWKYDLAVKTVKKVCKNIHQSFAINGYLDNCGFITKTDWKLFAATFGETSLSWDATTLGDA
jgi:hypothetical protein